MTDHTPPRLLPMSECRPGPGDLSLLYLVDAGYRIGMFRPAYSGRRGDTGEPFTSPAYWQVAGWGGGDLESIPFDDPELVGWYPLVEPRPVQCDTEPVQAGWTQAGQDASPRHRMGGLSRLEIAKAFCRGACIGAGMMLGLSLFYALLYAILPA